MQIIVWWVVWHESVRDAEAVFVDDIANLTGKVVQGRHFWVGQ